jgi:hypothetical protein
MGILLSHWHCILPAIGIIIAAFLLRDKTSNIEENQNSHNNQKNSFKE